MKKILSMVAVIFLLGQPLSCKAEEATAAPQATVSTPVAVDKNVPVKHKKHHHRKHAKIEQSAPAPVTPVATIVLPANPDITKNPVQARINQEKAVTSNPYVIVFYKPTYIIPFYYTGSPYNSAYRSLTPENESLKHEEVKYQLSFKVPLWSHIFSLPSTLFFGYTQMSYWQLYDHDPFFRSTDYEPEAFLVNELNWHLGSKWQFNFFNIGVVHQSNGAGGTLERSWNRAYLSAVFSTDHWVIALKPWIIFRDNTYLRQNPDMAKFMGYSQILVAFKYYNQALTLETRNFVESGGRRSGSTLSWSFPLTKYLKGYVQVFSGYGQSLIEYNHRTNSIGVGIALSNWV